MTLPRPNRNLASPIPNAPFSYLEEYYVETPQGKTIVGNGLEVNPATSELSKPGP